VRELTVVEAVRLALREELADDGRVIVLGEDVGPRGGVFQATAGLWREFGPQRVLDTPLAESCLVGVAIGAALAGLRPVAEVQFADFVHPAFNQLVNEAAKLRYRSNGGWCCPLVVRMPYGGVRGGGLYHGQSVEALFAHVPGLRVLSPSTPADAYAMLRWAIRCEDPVVFLEPKRIYSSIREPVDAGALAPPGEIGCAVRRPGTDVTAVAYGALLHHVLAAASALEAEDISVEVVEPRSFRPLDAATILASVRRTGRICIVHEDNGFCGFGAEIAARVAEEALFDLDAPVRRVTGPEVPGVPYAPSLEERMVPSMADLAGALRDLALF
jgi:2-oxoisovalerate dehydrogenase E1 component beta subunit